MELTYDTPGEAYVDIVLRTMTMGVASSPRGMQTKELLNVQFFIDQPAYIPFKVEERQLREVISRLEILSLLGQTPIDSLIRTLVPPMATYQDFGAAYGSYGARLRGQFAAVINTLLADRDSRRAVMTIYDGRSDLMRQSRDIPCTLTIQFMLREHDLWTRVSMRSNDVWLGLPYDLHQFCALHCAMAEILDVQAGPYCHAVGSLHAYQQHWELAETLTMNGIEQFHNARFFNMHSFDPMHRLEEVTTICQNLLVGRRRPGPQTAFENWLGDLKIGKTMSWA